MIVTDYTALLAYTESGYDWARWNAIANVGTQVVVTYSFYENDNLPTVSGSDVGRTTYWSYSEAEREHFRNALSEFEEVAGIRFVEVDGPAMINAFGYDIYDGVVGWAYYASSFETSTGSSDLAIGNTSTGSFAPGGFQYDTILHEIGHALGLKHPHDGDTVLADSVDTRDNTVMTYSPGVGTELGPLDIQALEHIYGSADSFDGWQITGGGSDAVSIRATNQGEVILGVDVDTIIKARGGRDYVRGRESDDLLKGGGGSDTVIGGLGEDTLEGGYGNDTLIGGIDEGDYSGEYSEADVLNGNKGRDVLYGNYGNDKLNGGRGKDTLFGGAGDDSLKGGHRGDTLSGGTGDDTLKGGGGKDILNGGDGDDVMKGGGGDDHFVFTSSDAYDDNSITDFQSDKDKIDLSGISQIDEFSDLTISRFGGNTTISYSNWFDLELTGYDGSLDAGDFIFT